MISKEEQEGNSINSSLVFFSQLLSIACLIVSGRKERKDETSESAQRHVFAFAAVSLICLLLSSPSRGGRRKRRGERGRKGRGTEKRAPSSERDMSRASDGETARILDIMLTAGSDSS